MMVRAVRAWPTDRARCQRAQLGVAQPTVAEQPQDRVIALADERSLVGSPDEVAVLG